VRSFENLVETIVHLKWIS